MPLWGSRSKPSSWGLFWHWSSVWVCPSHISFPLSCEYFWIYFTLPWLEQLLSFLSPLKIKGPLLQLHPFKARCFNFKWKFLLSQTVQNNHGKGFTISDHTFNNINWAILRIWNSFQRAVLTWTPVKWSWQVGTFLGEKMPCFNIPISLYIANGSYTLAVPKQRNELGTKKICLLPEGHEFHVWQHT